MKGFIGTSTFIKAEETSTQNEPAQTQKINLRLPKVAERVEDTLEFGSSIYTLNSSEMKC